MDNFIFQQQPNKLEVLQTNLYTSPDQADFLDEDDFPRTLNPHNKNITAKKIIKRDAPPKYSIRIGLNNKLFNPLSIYGKEKDSTFLDTVCRANDRFIDVNLKVFELYLSFLKTKNISWLHNAERELT
jgi:hypothetical protein